ncbi:MMPL family transporter [Shewanella maritima]|uniref:MMPL family transporter n=1 Tax=Shewanella maritima TaxID=2520507 RepID=UPI0037355208
MNWQTRLVLYAHHHPKTVIIGVIWLLLQALSGIPRINLEVDFNDYFHSSNPRLQALKQVQTRYQDQQQLLLLLETQNDWRNEQHQVLLQQFIDDLSTLPVVESIGGYAQFINQQASPLVLSYKQHPRLINVMSDSGKAVLLSLSLIKTHNPVDEIDELWNFSQQYWQSSSISASDANVYLSGTDAMNWQYAKVLSHDLRWFAPCLLLVIVVMAGIFIGNLRWLAAICLNILLSLLVAIALAAWCNLTLAAVSAFVPVVIVTLSLAYSAHLFFSWQQHMSNESGLLTDLQALLRAVETNRQPLFYGTITTVFGFSLLLFSPSPPIQAFGLLVATAVAAHYLLCHSVLVLFVASASTSTDKQKPHAVKFTLRKSTLALNAFSYALARTSQKLPKIISLLLVLLISLLAVFQASQLQFNDDPVNYFPKDNPFTESRNKMQQYFFGVNQLHYEVSATEAPLTSKPYISFIM